MINEWRSNERYLEILQILSRTIIIFFSKSSQVTKICAWLIILFAHISIELDYLDMIDQSAALIAIDEMNQ